MIVHKTIAVLRKDALSAIRYRNGFVLRFFSPAAQLGASYYLAKSVGSGFQPDGMPYFVFLVFGAGFYTFLIAGAHSLLRVIQESQQNGTLEVLMTTSTPPAALVSVSAVSALGGGALEFILYLIAGASIVSSSLHINYLGFASVFVLSALIASAIGLIAAALQIAMHKGSTALWLFGSGAWLLTGTMFPVHVLPPPLRVLSTLVPFTHSLAAMRMALYPAQSAISLGREIGVLFAFAVLMLPASIVLFSWTVRRARQLGTLSFY